MTGIFILSKKQVNCDEIIERENTYNKAREIDHMLRFHVTEQTGMPLETLYQNVVWQFDDCYLTFLAAVQMNAVADIINILNIPDNTKPVLITAIYTRFIRHRPIEPQRP